jgi:aminomethyltransferase
MLKRTPLYDAHLAQRAKLVDFAGWEMPIQYSGVVDEYHAVRRAVGLFDVSHMARILVEGEDALPFLQRLTTTDVAKLATGQSHYSMVCNPRGGIMDDIFIYRLGPVEFCLCVNASNREKIVAWLEGHQGKDRLVVRDRTEDLAQLALQGPASRSLLRHLDVPGLEALAPRQCAIMPRYGGRAFISRTGYTGELGYEIYVAAEHAGQIWDVLLTKGQAAGLKPVGLGARDLLRLDMGYLLYGNDINEETTPLEASAEWVVEFGKGAFIGDEALARQRDGGVTRRLIAFELLEKAVPRHGFAILQHGGPNAGQPIGEVTSGNLSPILQKGIGLGYVPPAAATQGQLIAVGIRGRTVPAVVVKPPFYKRVNLRGEG